MFLRHMKRSIVLIYATVPAPENFLLYPIAELGVYRGTYFAPPSIASALVQLPHQNFNLSHGILEIYLYLTPIVLLHYRSRIYLASLLISFATLPT